MRSFTAQIEFDPETRLYVGVVPDVPGAHTQGATRSELAANLREVIALCLDTAPESVVIELDPGRSIYGALAEFGPAPSAEEIDEARREAWAKFYDEDAAWFEGLTDNRS